MKITNLSLLSEITEPVKLNILQTCRILRNEGYQCYVVGGAVRDLILKKNSKDFDFTTDARPDAVIRLFKKTIPTGIKHGTVTVLMKNDVFEITTFRNDGTYSDARHPDSVRFSDTIDDDLSRRDFTINGLAYDPLDGILIDNYNGLSDIENKMIRTIGKAEDRFFEDGLRTIRACRFSSTLGFEISPETLQAMHSAEIHKRVKIIAVERFTDEILKGLESSEISRMIHFLEITGLVKIFIKEYPDSILNDESLRSLNELSNLPSSYKTAYWLRLAGIEKSMENILRELKFSGKFMRDAEAYGNIMDFQNESTYQLRKLMSSIKDVYGGESSEFIEKISSHSKNHKLIQNMIHELNTNPLIIKDLAVNGTDLMNAGYRGRDIGIKFKELLNLIWENPEYNKREILLEFLENRIED